MPKKTLKILCEILFLLFIYSSGLYFRLLPRLDQDPHLLTFEADIWYRLTMAQNLLDNGHLPAQDIRYQAYGYVPFWYPPLGLYALAGLSKITHLDLPTVASRVVPWIESLAPLSLYLFCRFLMGAGVAVLATLFLALTPSFVFWSGICDTQSFVLFMTPLVLLLWIKHVESLSDGGGKRAWAYFRILTLGGMLALCFLTHLFFFLLAALLFLISWACLLEKRNPSELSKFDFVLFILGICFLSVFLWYFPQEKASFLFLTLSGAGIFLLIGALFFRTTFRRKMWFSLLLVLLLSQLFTVMWWYPTNLYWWWIKSIVTSCGNYATDKKLSDYGVSAGIIGLYFFLLVLAKAFFRKRGTPLKYAWVPIFWAVIPLLETHNETILTLLRKPDLAWSTVCKPLEGFRFYCFLAQPLALGFGMIGMHFWNQMASLNFFKRKIIFILHFPLIFILLFVDMKIIYGFSPRIQNAGFTMDEIRAAQWFRENSKPNDRIIADYYRAQMFSGFAGGKALLGMAFPLRNVSYPYISQDNYTVPLDAYRIFTTDDPEEAVALMRRYGATHLLVSANMGTNANFILYGFGVPYNFKTLQDPQYFRPVYQEEGKVVILERVK